MSKQKDKSTELRCRKGQLAKKNLYFSILGLSRGGKKVFPDYLNSNPVQTQVFSLHSQKCLELVIEFIRPISISEMLKCIFKKFVLELIRRMNFNCLEVGVVYRFAYIFLTFERVYLIVLLQTGFPDVLRSFITE